MTLAQVKRSGTQRGGKRGGLLMTSVALFALAGVAGWYLAFGQTTSAPVDMVAMDVADQVPLVAEVARAAIMPDAPLALPIAPQAPAADIMTLAAAELALPASVVPVVVPASVSAVAAPVVTALVVTEPTSPVPETQAALSCIATLDAIAASLALPFEPYATQIASTALGDVFDLAAQVSECEAAQLTIAGHADPSGDETQNLLLSWQRAEFVVTELTRAGFNPTRFEAIGFGSRRPISEGAAGADDTLNRRVDFIVREAQP